MFWELEFSPKALKEDYGGPSKDGDYAEFEGAQERFQARLLDQVMRLRPDDYRILVEHCLKCRLGHELRVARYLPMLSYVHYLRD